MNLKKEYQDKRNTLGLIAGILTLVSIFFPWYELAGEIGNGPVYWKVYPLSQDYNELMKNFVFPQNWRAAGPPMPRVAIPIILAAIISVYSSLFVKKWLRRAFGLIISTFAILICIGDFVQGWMLKIMLSGLPIPPGELNFQEFVVTAQWGPGIYVAGAALIFTGLSVGLEILKTVTLMLKEAADSIKKMR